MMLMLEPVVSCSDVEIPLAKERGRQDRGRVTLVRQRPECRQRASRVADRSEFLGQILHEEADLLHALLDVVKIRFDRRRLVCQIRLAGFQGSFL